MTQKEIEEKIMNHCNELEQISLKLNSKVHRCGNPKNYNICPRECNDEINLNHLGLDTAMCWWADTKIATVVLCEKRLIGGRIRSDDLISILDTIKIELTIIRDILWLHSDNYSSLLYLVSDSIIYVREIINYNYMIKPKKNKGGLK
jgi:hypothetical protein